jgi:hypothetical protein
LGKNRGDGQVITKRLDEMEYFNAMLDVAGVSPHMRITLLDPDQTESALAHVLVGIVRQAND